MEDTEMIIGIVIVGIIALAAYFLPTIIAITKKNPYTGIVFVINLFFGWTLVVWVILLVWAIFPKDRSLISPIVSPSGNQSVGVHVGNAINDAKATVNYTNGASSISDMQFGLKNIAAQKETSVITNFETKMFCSKCGTKITEGAFFCAKCGCAL